MAASLKYAILNKLGFVTEDIDPDTSIMLPQQPKPPFRCKVSTLWSPPIYYMSLFTILASIASQLEKIRRNSLCSKRDSDNDFQWAS